MNKKGQCQGLLHGVAARNAWELDVILREKDAG